MPVLIAGLILAFLVMLLFGGTELDRGLLFMFSRSPTPAVQQGAEFVGTLTQPIILLPLAAIGAAVLFLRSQWQSAVLLLAAILIGRILVEGLQLLTESLRPAFDERMLASQQAGYPSSVAANVTMTGLVLAFLLTRHRPARALALGAAATLALIAGVAQLILGANWPSDVIGGWAVGLAWTLLLLGLAREDLSDGTARPVRHSFRQGETDGKPQNRDRPSDG